MTFENVLPIWWSFVWRTLVVSMIVGLVLGFFVGFIAALTGQAGQSGFVGGVVGWLGSIPVSIWALKAAINKHGLAVGVDN